MTISAVDWQCQLKSLLWVWSKKSYYNSLADKTLLANLLKNVLCFVLFSNNLQWSSVYQLICNKVKSKRTATLLFIFAVTSQFVLHLP